MAQTNPLQHFFRQPKFKITLPSRGRWYPANTLADSEGRVNVFAMTSVDDTRFKTNEILLSGTATYDLIRSCVPDIKDPEIIPTVDLDAIIMSIKRASYGDELTITVPVPKTNLTRELTLSIEQLVDTVPNAKELWDDQLIITNPSSEKLAVTIKPLTTKSFFNVTRELINHQEKSLAVAKENSTTDDKIKELDAQLKGLAITSVNTIADSISKITTDSGDIVSISGDIRLFLNKCDLEYVKAIQNHINDQKKKFNFVPIPCNSTEEELAAGAPAEWVAPVEFNVTSFFA